MTRKFFLVLLALFLTGIALNAAVGETGFAHPDDDWCWNDPDIDKALCRNLAQLDSAGLPTLQSQSITASNTPLSMWQAFKFYVGQGFWHILPKGMDHILFVLALFLAARRWQPLLLQISIFTVAHTISLGALTLGWLNIADPGWVEVIIAASIAYVAVENILFNKMRWWRLIVIFIFGLFHGIGFGGQLINLGLSEGRTLTSLFGFNVGVELGQIVVVALACIPAFYLYRLFKDEGVPQLYHKAFVVPASAVIGAVGLFWAIERALPLMA